MLQGNYRGHLHGIPFALKDLYDTAGTRTTSGSYVDLERVPTVDATTTARLKAAGGILVGKLAMHEFALGGPDWSTPFEPARNPWNLDHITGGSSSGTGSSVASGQVMGGLGSCTGGSIRGPASYCGIVGIKATYGRVSRAGVVTLSWSQDHAGPMTWTVEDCAYMLQAIAGHDPKDPDLQPRPGARLLGVAAGGYQGGHHRAATALLLRPRPQRQPRDGGGGGEGRCRAGRVGRQRPRGVAAQPGLRPRRQLGHHGVRGLRLPRAQPENHPGEVRRHRAFTLPHRRPAHRFRLPAGAARPHLGAAGVRRGDEDGGLPGNAHHDHSRAGLRGLRPHQHRPGTQLHRAVQRHRPARHLRPLRLHRELGCPSGCRLPASPSTNPA